MTQSRRTPAHTPERQLSPSHAKELSLEAAKPIGMFDSGVGGLTVLKTCLEALPNEDFIYFGDTARSPYGSRSAAEVSLFSKQIADYLITRHVKLLVIACNTASAVALLALQQRLTIPIVDVVRPGARAAVQESAAGRIGVLATQATVSSGSYTQAIQHLDVRAQVQSQACPLLVPMIERGEFDNSLVRSHYIVPLRAAGVDVVILGCTHYPLIEPMLDRLLGPDIAVVNSAKETASEVKELLARRGISREKSHAGEVRYVCSGDSKDFRSVGRRFLGMAVGKVERAYLIDGAFAVQAPPSPQKRRASLSRLVRG